MSSTLKSLYLVALVDLAALPVPVHLVPVYLVPVRLHDSEIGLVTSIRAPITLSLPPAQTLVAKVVQLRSRDPEIVFSSNLAANRAAVSYASTEISSGI